jgi:hypothetical protein
MQIGFLNRTPRGRTVTRLGYEHLGIPYKTVTAKGSADPTENPQMKLFD